MKMTLSADELFEGIKMYLDSKELKYKNGSGVLHYEGWDNDFYATVEVENKPKEKNEKSIQATQSSQG